MKQQSRILIPIVTLFIAIITLVSVMFGGTINSLQVFADETDYSAENRSKDFLATIYNAKNISYSNVQSLYSVNLYGNNDEVLAQASLFDRDGEIDYAVYNYITNSIDEFGFDCESALISFTQDEKLYYAGVKNYYTEQDNHIFDNVSGELTKQSTLFNKIKSFKEKLLERKSILSGGTTKPENGADGVINWKQIREKNAGWDNYDGNYVKGIMQGTIDDPIGIVGGNLKFSSMNSLSQNGLYKNHCGPTALTNIMVYYDWRGKENMLVNNSRQDTFERLRVLCKHDGKNTISLSNVRTALTTYLNERGYTVSLSDFNNVYRGYKNAIDNDKLVLTLLNVTQADNYKWGHFVLTLGYEEFRQEYKMKVLWWYETSYNYMRYIRVCDGWDSCDLNQFVDLTFYDSYNNSAITIS